MINDCIWSQFYVSLWCSGLIWSWSCLTRLTKEYYHRWSHLSKVRHIEKKQPKKLQLVIYNPIRPNVQAKLDLKWPQMTFTYLIHSSERSKNKRKNNFYFSKNVFGQSLRCISDFINRSGVLWVFKGFYGVFIGQSWG